jgi:Mn-dependent DtxR family transcriptional regulator
MRDEAGDQLERAGKRTGRDLLRRRRRLEAGLERAASRAKDVF